MHENNHFIKKGKNPCKTDVRAETTVTVYITSTKKTYLCEVLEQLFYCSGVFLIFKDIGKDFLRI